MRRFNLKGAYVFCVLAIQFWMVPVWSSESAVKGSIPTTGIKEKDFPSLVKVTLAEALAIASRAIPGKVIQVHLENEDGYLVYSVEISDSGRRIMEINIDAGSGKILSQNLADNESDKAGGKNRNRDRD